jgi:hypothetical protein
MSTGDSLGAEFRVSTDHLAKTIKACENAEGKIAQILHLLQLQGQSSQEWARDAVSLDVADYYTRQLWEGGYCTYSTLDKYQKDLRAAISALRRAYVDYPNTDADTAGKLEQL